MRVIAAQLFLVSLILCGCTVPDRPTRAVVRVEVKASPLGTVTTVAAEVEVK